MLLKGHKGSLDIKVVNLLRNSLKQMVVDGGRDIWSNSAPESQVNGSIILLNEPGVSVLEVVGPQLAEVVEVSVPFLTLPGPENLTEDVPRFSSRRRTRSLSMGTFAENMTGDLKPKAKV